MNFPAPTSPKLDPRNQPQSSTGTPTITAPATCFHTDQSTSDSTVPLHEVQQHIDELTDSLQNASTQATDPNVLFPSQRLRQPLSIRTLDNTTISPNFPHSPTAVLTPLPVESNSVDNHPNPDNPCDPSPINPVHTHYVASQASTPPSDTHYRQPPHAMPPHPPETHGPCDITKRHTYKTLSSSCPISQSLSPMTHECLLLETLPHTQIDIQLTSSPPNILPTHSCPTLPVNALDPSNQCSPPLSSPQAHTLPQTIINPTETHSTDSLSNSPLHNPTQITLVQDDVPQFTTPQTDAIRSQPITATFTPLLAYHSSPIPHKKKPSLSKVAAKTSNRGNGRPSDQLTLTSLWGAHRASQHDTSIPQQAANVSKSADTARH
ncbi:hypothetical protein PHET_12402 [Paragonimus heterotremus]|uniref:Uncharacterized protein n=1 Tax=Paragonimus heterotremus TaxID=100268 RepID=A0A8J4WD12_9TREM|nr:hypothetical protein PHET_12402 [Paragonimus heterotremus]